MIVATSLPEIVKFAIVSVEPLFSVWLPPVNASVPAPEIVPASVEPVPLRLSRVRHLPIAIVSSCPGRRHAGAIDNSSGDGDRSGIRDGEVTGTQADTCVERVRTP